MGRIVEGEDNELRGDGAAYSICNILSEVACDQPNQLPQEAILYLACWAFHQDNFSASLRFLRQPQVNWYINLSLVCEVYVSCRQLKRLCCELGNRFATNSLKRPLLREVIEEVTRITCKYSSEWKPLIDFYWNLM